MDICSGASSPISLHFWHTALIKQYLVPALSSYAKSVEQLQHALSSHLQTGQTNSERERPLQTLQAAWNKCSNSFKFKGERQKLLSWSELNCPPRSQEDVDKQNGYIDVCSCHTGTFFTLQNPAPSTFLVFFQQVKSVFSKAPIQHFCGDLGNQTETKE